jgi:hypothetical protein
MLRGIDLESTTKRSAGQKLFVFDDVLSKKSLAFLNVIELVKSHGGLTPEFAFNRFQKLLEDQNIHHFEITRINSDRAFAGKLTLTTQSKSRQSQRKAVDQREEPAERTREAR